LRAELGLMWGAIGAGVWWRISRLTIRFVARHHSGGSGGEKASCISRLGLLRVVPVVHRTRETSSHDIGIGRIDDLEI